MRQLVIILCPVFLLMLFPFVFIFETTILLYTMIFEYVEFLREHYIPEIKNMINRENL